MPIGMTETKAAAPDLKLADAHAPAGFASLHGEKVRERSEDSVTLEFSIPGSSPYFEGHFPAFPILPAVAQTDMIIRYASRYLGTGLDVSEITRMKFTAMIRPSVPLVLKIDKKGKNISFKITSPDNNTAYSSGTLELRESRFPGESE